MLSPEGPVIDFGQADLAGSGVCGVGLPPFIAVLFLLHVGNVRLFTGGCGGTADCPGSGDGSALLPMRRSERRQTDEQREQSNLAEFVCGF